MSQITVVAQVVANPESVERVRGELLKLVAPTRAEAGCIEYRLHQDREDPALFIFYENWESRECLARHMESDHFTAYIRAVDGLLAGKTVHIMTMIG